MSSPASLPGARFALAGTAATGTLVALGLVLGVIETPDVADTLSDAADSLGAWTYLAVPGLAFLETGAFVGLVVPGETAIVVGGVVAERGEVELPVLIGLVWVAAVSGDVVSFLLGRRFGRPLLDAHGPRLRIRPEQVELVERLFDRHGGKTVLVGRFVGILRALTPFVAGASRFSLRRFLPYTAVGALGWATTFTLVGYGFSESFESAGRNATRIVLVAALIIGTIMLVLAVRSGRSRRADTPEPHRDERRQSAEPGSDDSAGEDVEREVHTEVDARQGDGRGEAQGVGAHPRAEDRYRGGGGEGDRGVSGGEGGVVRKRDERPEPRVVLGRAVAVELEELRHHDQTDGSDGPRLLLVINARASGIENPRRTATELVALLQELGATAEAVISSTEDDLFEALEAAAATGRRAVLVGGDGSLHDAANAPLDRLPELALVPAGRANNVARGLGIPVRRDDALVVAARGSVRPIDALHVQTPQASVYAIEAVSGGFQAAARGGYAGENSGDLRQGLGVLVRAVRNYTPYTMRVGFDDGELAAARGAQLFVSNLPRFGFGFCVDPGADPGDGRVEITVMEAAGRRRLLWLLAAAYRGRHLGRRGVRRVSSERAEVLAPIPLVADTVALGTTTATVTVDPARLWVAAPSRAVAP